MSFEETLRAIMREEIERAVRTVLRPVEQMPVADRYLPVANAAEIAAVHDDTMRGWLKAGLLPAHHAGRELRVKLSELERFMAGCGSRGKRQLSVEEEAAAALARARR